MMFVFMQAIIKSVIICAIVASSAWALSFFVQSKLPSWTVTIAFWILMLVLALWIFHW